MKTAEAILNKYFPEPDDLVDGRIRNVVIKAMEEYRNQEPKGIVYVPVAVKDRLPNIEGEYIVIYESGHVSMDFFSLEINEFADTVMPKYWLEETTLPIADIAGKAWDSGWQYGHADGAGIMEFTNPQTKEQFIQSLNQSTK